MPFIYMLTFSNGKKYIGQTRRTLTARMRSYLVDLRYRPDSNRPVEKAFKELGPPIITILEECDILSLNEKEQFYIALHNTQINGYNCTPGGETMALIPKHIANSNAKFNKRKNKKQKSKTLERQQAVTKYLEQRYPKK